jgi:hypothetical protein
MPWNNGAVVEDRKKGRQKERRKEQVPRSMN